MRPIGSKIRNLLVTLTYYSGPITGYELHKLYVLVVGKCTQRTVYYHLHKGLETKEFVISHAKETTGNYSWGDKSKKIYYEAGSKAQVINDPFFSDAVKESLKKIRGEDPSQE